MGLRHDVSLPPVVIEETETPDYPGIAIWYAEHVVAGDILACRMIRLACERFLRMVERAERQQFQRGELPYWWSPEHVIDVCGFEEKMPHVEGYVGDLVLQPWQIWENAAIWGFRRENGTRLVRLVSEWLPRKHGKSLRAATRGHFIMTCEEEPGPLGYICAAIETQANKVFAPMAALIDKAPDFAAQFEAAATLKKITYGVNDGLVEKLSSVGEHQDGHNPHWVCMEELHAQKPDVYKVMRSALRSRKNPMFMTVSTAGRRAHGIGWDMWKFCERVLEGTIRADHVFALIAAADPEDVEKKRLGSIVTVRKANPNYGVSIDEGVLEEYLVETKASPSGAAEFNRTTFNIWSRGANGIVSGDDWDRCAVRGLRIADFAGERAFLSADLASRNDLAAISAMFQVDEKVQFFSRYYICEDAPAFEIEEYADLYNQWHDLGWLIYTPGGYIDFEVIEDDLRDWAERFDTQAIVLDDYQANQMLAGLRKAGHPAMVFKKTAKVATEPTDEILARIRAGLFEHDGNPVTRWCAMNVVGHRDENDNLLPKRDKTRPGDKIDGFDTLMMANAARLASELPKRRHKSIYEERGLMGFDDAA